MMTNNEIIQIIIGMILWQFTWELFFGQYFYTKSEKKIISEGRAEGGFTSSTLMSTFFTIAVYAIVFFKIVKYIY